VGAVQDNITLIYRSTGPTQLLFNPCPSAFGGILQLDTVFIMATRTPIRPVDARDPSRHELFSRVRSSGTGEIREQTQAMCLRRYWTSSDSRSDDRPRSMYALADARSC
jgi:hypothetical protein